MTPFQTTARESSGQRSCRHGQAHSRNGSWGTLRRECPDHVLILGKQHLREVLADYVRHYNGHRPHERLRQEPLLVEPGHVAAITTRIAQNRHKRASQRSRW